MRISFFSIISIILPSLSSLFIYIIYRSALTKSQKRLVYQQKPYSNQNNLQAMITVDCKITIIIMSILQSSSKFGTSSKRTSDFQSTINRPSLMNHEKDLLFMGQPKDQLLVFTYRRGSTYTLFNRDIKLKNQSSTHIIKFKIQSNNPSHYNVHPSTAEIAPNKTIEIVIQVNGLDQVAQIGQNFFAKFASDKFKLTWFSFRQNQRMFLNSMTHAKFAQCKKIFKVKIEIEDDPNQQAVIRKKPIQLGEQVVESLENHKKQLIKLQNLISVKEIQNIDQSYITCNAILFLSFAAFILGIVSPFG